MILADHSNSRTWSRRRVLWILIRSVYDWRWFSLTIPTEHSNSRTWRRGTGFTDPDPIRVTRIRKFLFGSDEVWIRFSVNPHSYGNSGAHTVFSARRPHAGGPLPPLPSPASLPLYPRWPAASTLNLPLLLVFWLIGRR